MGALCDDEMLASFAVVGPADTVAAALRRRRDGAVDRVLPIFPTASASCVVAILKEFRE